MIYFKFKAGDLLRLRLSNGQEQHYIVSAFLCGVAGELSVIRLEAFDRKNTIDGRPEKISVPCAMLRALVDGGLVDVIAKGEA